MIRGRRAAGIVGIALFGLTACDIGGATSGPTPATATPVAGASHGVESLPAFPGGADATSTWQPSLKPKADTFYFGQGSVPNPVVDRTSASGSGRLLLRAECTGGKLTPVVAVDGTDDHVTFTCDGQVQEKYLQDVRKGQQVSIHPDGDGGVQFAYELVIQRADDSS